MTRRYEIGFYPGVKERDIPNLPRPAQEQLVYRLRDLSEGKTKGAPLGTEHQNRPPTLLEKAGCRKLHINDPKDFVKVTNNKNKGRKSSEGVSAEGGYRIVFREATVRGKPTMAIVAVGPRKGMAAYKAAEHRLAKQKTSAQQTGLQHSSGKPLKPQAPQESNAATSRRSSPPQTRGRSR